MQLIFPALLSFGILELCLATAEQQVRWCVQSENEQKKCNELKEVLKGTTSPSLTCVKKISYKDCFRAIWKNEADAISVDGGLVYEAVAAPFGLKPIIAEDYGSEKEQQIYSFAVAVVKKGTDFQLKDLKGKKSCHTGLGMSAGWIIPVGKLVELGVLNWNNTNDPIEKEVATFFSDSCVPCAFWTDSRLCHLCTGAGPDQCACSDREPYFGSSGALKCLKDGVGDVSFMEHTTLLETLPTAAKRDKFELLCEDGTRLPIDEYRKCHLGKVSANAVVSRRVNSKEDLIWNLLSEAQKRFGKGKSEIFQLFGSHHGKDLLFKDSTNRFLRLPAKMDHEQYLGYKHMKAVKTLTISKTSPLMPRRMSWCAVSKDEEVKCREWSMVSGLAIECVVAETTEECIDKIMKGEAEAMSLDGGFIYIAGKCGLEIVLAENYKTKDSNHGQGPLCPIKPIEGYYAVAVVKKSDANLKWGSLQGKKSCHTGINRAAGWNIPMSLIHDQTNSCEFDKYFSESCAPGADVNSSLCALCVGSPGRGDLNKCAANSKEKYYGYTGAFRCLAENKGDVAFVKHSTVLENTDGQNKESWAQNLKSGDFELLCLDGKRKPVREAKNCHLAQVPNHAVVSRPDKAAFVRHILLNQQDLFGTNGTEWQMFQMFQSKTKDVLFTDNTECLSNVPDKRTYEKYLGPEYIKVIESLRKCSDTSDLLTICEFINP
ncbi:inhibitor of carbonic anhydrase-like isoform 1-T2 [Sarcophilus harrisii]|uniref:Transferrin-like domain-containing protein n=1 Tax=Sarcophilus harrisii TaxID=9305 RepID=G3WL58_SARHA|nr:inhibitor of carbonic anhydrase precursor [Sarcophilus harrisii]